LSLASADQRHNFQSGYIICIKHIGPSSRRTFLKQANGFDPSFFQRSDCWCRSGPVSLYSPHQQSSGEPEHGVGAAPQRRGTPRSIGGRCRRRTGMLGGKFRTMMLRYRLHQHCGRSSASRTLTSGTLREYRECVYIFNPSFLETPADTR